MRDSCRKAKISEELDKILTGVMMEVYAGVTPKDEALELLEAMKAEIIPAIRAIDETAESIRK